MLLWDEAEPHWLLSSRIPDNHPSPTQRTTCPFSQLLQLPAPAPGSPSRYSRAALLEHPAPQSSGAINVA